MNEIDDTLFQQLMSCPIKRQLILEVINSEKEQIENYQRDSDNERSTSKNPKKNHYESPAALLRQRALRQQNSAEIPNSPSRRHLEVSSSSHSAITPNNILAGVISFVEVKSRNQDRSQAVKALMREMGSDVRDTFTKDVTHVIFKDGSYTTYQKARLMDVHLLSVLWIDACKQTGIKIPESQYPALGTEAYDHNASNFCSQLQQEYEEIIRDELKKSFTFGTPLPSKKDLISRRKTLATSISKRNSQAFSRIKSRERRRTCLFGKSSQISPEITSDDDSEVGAVIDGNLISKSRHPSSLETYINATCDESINMEFTNINDNAEQSMDYNNRTNLLTPVVIDSSLKENDSSNISSSIYNMKTPKLKQNNNLIETPKNSVYGRPSLAIFKNSSPLPHQSSSTTDKDLRISLLSSEPSRISILSKNALNSSPVIHPIRKVNVTNETSSNSNMSSLQVSEQTNPSVTNGKINSVSSSSNMSSLQISSAAEGIKPHKKSKQSINVKSLNKNTVEKSSKKQNKTPRLSINVDPLHKNLVEKSGSSNMSSLRISSESSNVNTTSSTRSSRKRNSKSNLPSNMDSLDKNLIEKSGSSKMSSLRISSENNNVNTTSSTRRSKKLNSKSSLPSNVDSLDKNLVEKSSSSKMSSLRISSENSNTNIPFGKKKTKNKKLSLPTNNTLDNNIVEISSSSNISSKNDNIKAKSSIEDCNEEQKQKSPEINDDSSSTNISASIVSFETTSSNVNTIPRNIHSLKTNTNDELSKLEQANGNAKLAEGNDNQRKLKTANQIRGLSTNKSSLGSNNSSKQSGLVERTSTKSFGSNSSFSPIKPVVLKNIFDTLDFPEYRDKNVTRRRKQIVNSKHSSPSPKKRTKKDEASDHSTPKESLETNTKPSPRMSTNLRKSRRQSKLKLLEKYNSSDDKFKCTPPKIRKSLRKLEKSNVDPENAKTSTDESVSHSSEKRRRIRKLYNPDESFTRTSTIDDETERGDRRVKVRRQKSTGVVLVPEIIQTKSTLILSDRTKEFLNENNIDIETILNDGTETNRNDDLVTTAKKNKKHAMNNTDHGDRDEQKELALIILNERNNQTSTKTSKQNSIEIPKIDNVLTRRQSKRVSERNLKVIDNKSPKRTMKPRSTPQTTGKITRKKPSQKSNYNITSQPNFHSSSSSKIRRSTMDFQDITETSSKRKLKIDRVKKSSIVCTKLHREDVLVFNQIVKKIGGFFTENEVSDRTTHLVAGEPKRTINMLRAITRGCWILKYEWVLKSLEAGKWLPEEDFEITNFSPAVQQCRLQRQAFGSSYSMDILKECGPIYVARGSLPRCSDLRELVELCKGKVTTILRNATIVIGGFVKEKKVTCVQETWLLDSIKNNKKQKFSKYIIQESNNVVL